MNLTPKYNYFNLDRIKSSADSLLMCNNNSLIIISNIRQLDNDIEWNITLFLFALAPI